jgi:hypothetical protein
MKKLFGINSVKTKNLVKKIVSVKFIAGLAVVLAVVAFGAWQYHDTTNADRVFWGAVDSSLQTSSYSRHSVSKSGGQSADQVIDVYLSPKQGVFSQTTYEQTGPDEAQAVTENIGTPYADYVRYTSITTNQKNAAGKSYDFSKIINVWGSSTPDKAQTNGQLFGQSVLGSIPTANLTASQRRVLVKMMKEKGVYTYTAKKTSHEGTFARPSYTYNVTIDPSAYVETLKQFGEFIGVTQLRDLDVNDYKKANKIQFQFTVDGWSHQVTSMVQPGGSKSEAISGLWTKCS